MDILNNSIVTDADTEVLDSQITQISNDFSETYYFDSEQEEELELLVAKAMKLGELYERKKWQAAKAHEAEKLKAVHDSRIQFVEYVNKIENGDYVLVSKQCPDPDFADALFDLLSKKAIGEFGEDQMIYFSDIDEEKIWALMIEAAQEPAND